MPPEIEIKTRPIPFSGAMVNAILAGRKTQTRRIMKPQPHKDFNFAAPANGGWVMADRPPNKKILNEWLKIYDVIKCPYGVAGERLWVKEIFQGPILCAVDGGEIIGRTNSGLIEKFFYKATDPQRTSHQGELIPWRSYRYQPKWASRITLEVVDVRVERVQKIKKAGAFAEGVVQINKHFLMDPEVLKTPVKYSNVTQLNDERYWGNDNAPGAFASYWEKINGDDSWDANPWVWVIEFKHLKK